MARTLTCQNFCQGLASSHEEIEKINRKEWHKFSKVLYLVTFIY